MTMLQPFTGPMRRRIASVNGKISGSINRKENKEDVSRVAAWAVNFGSLLRDKSGLKLFTEFLKREFSDENIDFWKECEEYKDFKDVSSRKRKAKAIFEKYITSDAPRAVNIDDITRQQVEAQLENPSSETFVDAQTKTFYLMKQDSYSRFLKSDLYKNRLMINMEKKMQDLRISMDTKGDSAQEKKGGSLQRHFKNWTTTVNYTRTDNRENEENHGNSWIRRRMDSMSNILKRNKRNRH